MKRKQANLSNGFESICNLEHDSWPPKKSDQKLSLKLYEIRQLLHIETLSVAIYNGNNKQFYLFSSDTESDLNLESCPTTIPDDFGLADMVLREQKSIIINDASDQYHLTKNHLIKSVLCIPLKMDKEIIGLLYAADKNKNTFANKELVEIVELTAQYTTLYIENTILKNRIEALSNPSRPETAKNTKNTNKSYKLIGESSAIQLIYKTIHQLANSKIPVLIQGETGTGKELIAKAIHYSGSLKNQPLIVENCGAIPENIIESELFGHVKGAFTDAYTNKPGLFSMADGGTLFLDEIGEISQSVQVKLLRVLQDGIFRPVGSNKYQKVNIRLITSTNKNLEEEIQKGNFRQDLYYRISVFKITPPPLRNRKKDIALLARYFLKKFAAQMKISTPEISKRAMDLLENFSWPGNIRELENEMHRAIILIGTESTIRPFHLSEKIRTTGKQSHSLIPFHFKGSLKESIQHIETHIIHEVLKKTGGNRAKAARLLGLTRQGLLNKIKRYNIQTVFGIIAANMYAATTLYTLCS